jgi:hypothetical protein
MHTKDFHRSLTSLFNEIVNGVPVGIEAFALNPGDAGLLASLDQISAASATRAAHGGATVAAHVKHLSYGFSLMNRWAQGENPFPNADWSAAWRTREVTETEWSGLRAELRREAGQWHDTLSSDREVHGTELDAVIGTIIHAAYHLGAIRQIVAEGRGPKATSP